MAKANNFAYSTVFQTALDRQIAAVATTGWMELNSGLVRYEGGAEVKIPSIVMDGLADYDRAKGFVDGSVTLTWQTHRMTQDRGRSFSLDAMDVSETNFVATAGQVMGEFQRQHVVTEIDAYRYSKLAQIAATAGRTRDAEITKDNIVEELLTDLAALEDTVGLDNLVITLNPILAMQLGLAGEKFMSKTDLRRGEINTRVDSFNEAALVRAGSQVLKTSFVFSDGTTGGQEVGGFSVAEDARDINWIITPRTTPVAISKTDKVRTFSPDVNQQADAWKVDYRKYHDLWVLDNQTDRIIVNLKPKAGA